MQDTVKLINKTYFYLYMGPWIREYSPKKIKEVIAQDNGMTLIRFFIENFKKQKKKAVLIYGPSGIGKTSAVYAIANELGLEIIEMNASDFRNKDQINSIAGVASQQMSLFGKSKLILIDELDGIAGRQDFGGVAAIAKLIAETKFPIIITANNPYDNKFSSIRKKTEMLQFKLLETNDIYEILKNICIAEGITYKDNVLKTLARRSGGDARAAINDLQILSGAEKKLEKDAIDELSERNKVDSILNALVKIFKSTNPNIAITAFDNVDEDLDKCFLWVDENLPKEYTKADDLARAYDKLSKADVFRGRIKRWQHWRFLSYINNLLTAGVAVCKDEKNKRFVQYKPTGRILKLWWAKQKNIKKKAVVQKIAEKTHTSSKEIFKNFEFIQAIFKNNKEMAGNMIKQFDLNNEEVEWLKKT